MRHPRRSMPFRHPSLSVHHPAVADTGTSRLRLQVSVRQAAARRKHPRVLTRQPRRLARMDRVVRMQDPADPLWEASSTPMRHPLRSMPFRLQSPSARLLAVAGREAWRLRLRVRPQVVELLGVRPGRHHHPARTRARDLLGHLQVPLHPQAMLRSRPVAPRLRPHLLQMRRAVAAVPRWTMWSSS